MRTNNWGWDRLLPLLLALAAVAWFNSWVISPRHFFFADDWGWLMRAEFLPWREAMHLLPTSIYNDRPGGEFIIRLMYERFWLRAGPYNLLWLMIHVVNCGLLYLVVSRYLPPVRAALAATLAGCWFSTLTAVHWIGAVFDLAGATWCLLTLYCYIRTAEVRRNPWLPALAAVAFHVLAIRTKELALALIVVLVAWEFLVIRQSEARASVRRLLPHALVTLVFVAVYAKLYIGAKQQLDTGAYAMSFSPSEIVQGVGYYFAQAFYAFTPGSNATNIAAGLIFAALVVIAACSNRFGIASVLCGAALCAAVLLLSRQRHPLYLYVPHFLIAAALCSVAVKSRLATAATAILVAVLIAWPVYTGFWRDARNFVLIKGGYSRTLFYDYANLMKNSPAPDRVRVSVAEAYFDPFSWGTGSAIQIYHKKQDIAVEVEVLPTATREQCLSEVVCLEEVNGRLRRAGR